jgi:hypothetical protein
VDIFALTGQKVEIDDPIVAAALIHSALLRRAGQDAACAMKDAAQEAIEALESGLQQQRQVASELHQARQQSPERAAPISRPTLALLCLITGALGAVIALGAARWLG